MPTPAFQSQSSMSIPQLAGSWSTALAVSRVKPAFPRFMYS